MAYQPPGPVCARCGAPLAPGAMYCGRCGTPVAMQAVAAPPMYRYPPAPPATYPTAGRYRLRPALVAGGLVLVLIVVAVLVGGLAVAQFTSGSHSTCISNCSPKVITPLAEEATFQSARFKFQVNYPARWTVRTQGDAGVTLATKLGFVSVTGSSGANADQVLQSVVSGLPSSQYQDVTLVAGLKGAHIGNQDGIGQVYAANLVGPSQTATKVRFAVIVARQRGVTVAIFALNPADPKNYPNGMPEGQSIDYLCTEFVWP
ncbi:MAG TPA: zinc ribbon domain-containing protein [Candidatus Limnocylindrales bacterium]|nr:zinc ribbon domain-containing protein [Candidatus Limnocylindrales bacterium]